MRPTVTMWKVLGLIALLAAGPGAKADARQRPAPAAVRFQAGPASESGPGWHAGVMRTHPTGCTMIAMSDPGTPGGQRYLGLSLVTKLQRANGMTWVDVSIAALLRQEPSQCHEAVGG